jgi:L-seryl-tRNA(Ser) seleniumtransferase
MRLSGARLVEVGTTNKTRASDYRAAIGEATGVLLKVHPSNFVQLGFTAEVGPAELADLGRETGVSTMMDLGSGLLLAPAEVAALGLPAEPGVAEVVAAGIDIVTFSGDKLLGGPQAGIICGKAASIEAIRRHPLMRALRPDKLTLAALIATLTIYRDGRPQEHIPALAMLAETADSVRYRADAVCSRIAAALDGAAPDYRVGVRPCDATVGGGAMPQSAVPSWAVAITAATCSGATSRAIHMAMENISLADALLRSRSRCQAPTAPTANAVVR